MGNENSAIDTSAHESGTVKWFDNAKGYGFLLDTDQMDVFVHYRSILSEGYKTLKEGQHVSFLRTKTDKGWSAAEVLQEPEGT